MPSLRTGVPQFASRPLARLYFRPAEIKHCTTDVVGMRIVSAIRNLGPRVAPYGRRRHRVAVKPVHKGFIVLEVTLRPGVCLICGACAPHPCDAGLHS